MSPNYKIVLFFMVDTPTNDVQPGAENIPAAGGNEAGSQTPASTQDGQNLTLAEINELLGKQYPDKTTALKSLKDMSSFAGRAADQLGKQNDEAVSKLQKEIDAMKLDTFYARNPEHEANREILEALALKNNVTVEEATELDAYKEFAKGVKKEKRTVVESNTRQQPSDDKKKAFEEAKKTGDFGKYLADFAIKQ